MASNKDLITAIEAEAEAKGVDVPATENLTNAQLAETLKRLRGPAPAPGTGEDEDDVIEPAKVERPPYYICDGKSLTTLKGILGPGDEIKAEYLTDGDEGIKRHRQNGIVAKA